MTDKEIIQKLIAVARAAYFLADNTECNSTGYKVTEQDFDNLSDALDSLDLLPEMPPPYVGTGPAKAEWLLIKSKE